MPERRYYTVTQEREVKIAANSAVEAATFASLAFEGEDIPPSEADRGSILAPVRIRDIVAREDY